MTEEREKSTNEQIAQGILGIFSGFVKGFFQGLTNAVTVLIAGGIVGAIAGGGVALFYGLSLQLILWGAIGGFVVALFFLVLIHSGGSFFD